MTVCVLLRRQGRWLLGVRAPGVADAPGRLGLIGGHVEATSAEPQVLEAAGRREVAEETGLDLGGTQLSYLESELFFTDGGAPQITVTFVAEAPAGSPAVRAADELVEVGWWTFAEVASDPRCPDWLPPLLRRAERPDPQV